MKKKPLAVMLIHGFGGGEYEVEPLARRLLAEGISCHLVRLAGHPDPGQPIENLPYTRWVDSAREKYNELRQHHRVVCVGFSMGGLIAAILNTEAPFAALVLISTPIYFWNLPQVARNLKEDFKPAFHHYFVESAGRTPPPSLIQFLRILSQAHRLFTRVHCPALVVQAKDDDTVWPQSALYICKKVQGSCDYYCASAGGHTLLLDEFECSCVAMRVIDLLSRIN